jgi:hypothetical protein
MEGNEKGKGGGTGQRRTTQLGCHCRFSGNGRQKRYYVYLTQLPATVVIAAERCDKARVPRIPTSPPPVETTWTGREEKTDTDVTTKIYLAELPWSIFALCFILPRTTYIQISAGLRFHMPEANHLWWGVLYP